MNWLDILLAIVLAAGTFFGLRQGFIQSITGLIGIILAVVIAGNFYLNFGSILNLFSPTISNFIAFTFILLGVLVLAYFTGRILKAIMKTAFLGWTDNLAGGVAGLIFAVILVSTLLAIWAKFFGSAGIADSLIAQALLDSFPLILGLLPSEFDSIREFFQESSGVLGAILSPAL